MVGVEATGGVQGYSSGVSSGQSSNKSFTFNFAEILKKVFGDDGKATANTYLGEGTNLSKLT